MEQLILIRHGEVPKNTTNIIHAKNETETLTPLGELQMQKTASHMRSFLPFSLYASTEERARISAEIIATTLSIPFKTISSLGERDWGTYAGRTWDDVQKELQSMTVDERYHFLPPGGESWEQMEDRLHNALTELQGQTVVVVTHGGVIRALIPYLLGIGKEESFKYQPDNGSVSIFAKTDDAWRATILNDTTHLQT